MKQRHCIKGHLTGSVAATILGIVLAGCGGGGGDGGGAGWQDVDFRDGMTPGTRTFVSSGDPSGDP